MYSEEFEILENPNKKWHDFYQKIQRNKQNIKKSKKVDTTMYTTYQTFTFPD